MRRSTKVRFWLARQVLGLKGLSLGYIPNWSTAWLDHSFGRLVEDGYKKNSAVAACIATLAMSYPEPPLQVIKKSTGEPLINHRLQKLLDRPNINMSGKMFSLQNITYAAIGGSSLIHKVRNGSGMVIELIPYHIGFIRPERGEQTWIKQYLYNPGNGRPEIPIKVEDIIHLRWPSVDPSEPWLPIAPLRLAAYDTDTDNELTRYQYTLLKNNSVPPVAIETPEDAPEMSDEDYERFMQRWQLKHSGSNRGLPAILQGGAKISRIGMSMAEMALDVFRDIPESRIAAAFRVPAIVAGLNVGLKQSTYSNFQEARQQFVEQTLMPMWSMHTDELTASLAPDFGDEIEITYDLSKIVALQENEDAKYSRAVQGYDGGLLTRNEARQLIGFEPTPDGDIFKQLPQPAPAIKIIDGELKQLEAKAKTAKERAEQQYQKRVAGYLADQYRVAKEAAKS